MWRVLGGLSLHFAIIALAIQKSALFSYICCQFSPLRWSHFDLEQIYFAFMNTSSYNPVASCTYNRWRVESVKKNGKQNQYNHGIHSKSLLFEGNASLKASVWSIPCLSACQSIRLTDSGVSYLGQDFIPSPQIHSSAMVHEVGGNFNIQVLACSCYFIVRNRVASVFATLERYE